MGAEHRSKIGNSRILSRLIGHVEGTDELSATQVTAGLGLLKKVMPDMTESMVKGSGESGELVFKTIYETIAAKDA